jgi:hypothetical protein
LEVAPSFELKFPLLPGDQLHLGAPVAPELQRCGPARKEIAGGTSRDRFTVREPTECFRME